MTHEVVLQGYNVKPGSLQLGTFDSYGIEKIHVTADDEWAGLDILAVFHAPDGTATKVVVGANGMLAVPPEATAKQAGGGRIVFAGLAENVQRITVDMRYSTKPHSDIKGDNPGTPTPDVVQQILENSNHAVSIATAAQDAAENARQAAEDAAKKAGEGAGGAAASAAAAKKSAEDAAASSKSAAGKAEAAESSANVANESAKAAQTAQGSAENAAQTAADAAGVARQVAGVAGSAAKASSTSAGEAAQSAEAAETAKQIAEDAAKKALEAKTGSENALQDADAAKDAASGYADAAAKSVTAAAASEKNAAKSANSAADSAAAAKKSADDANNTANSIKDSMTQISENKEAVSKLKEDTAALQKRQNVLVGSETGNPVSCNDAFAAPLCGLTVYGKSTQDGTPSPDNPVPIVSAGDSGSVAVRVTGANMLEGTKPGVQSTVYGINYTIDENGVLITGTATKTFNISLHEDNKYRLTRGIYYLTTSGLSPSTILNFYYIGKFSSDMQNQKVTLARDVDFSLVLQILGGATLNTTVQVSLTRNKITTYAPYREQLLTLPTPNGLPGIPVTSGGNYTDPSGQQWVCDEVDLERGVKVQRVKVLDINDTSLRLHPSSNSYWYVSTFLLDCSLNNTGTESYKEVMCQKFPVVSQLDETKYSYPIVAPYGHVDRVELRFRAPEALYATIEDFRQTIVGTKVYYPLATPVETPLTPAEIAAYKALTAYAPDTVVQASDGAGVKLEYQRDVNIAIKNLEEAIASMTTT